jgi:hypothetical protein
MVIPQALIMQKVTIEKEFNYPTHKADEDQDD